MYERGVFLLKCVRQGKELDLGAEPPRIKFCRVPPSLPPENYSLSSDDRLILRKFENVLN